MASVPKLVEPTSLRRSPRFRHLQDSPKTPKLTIQNPISISSLSSQSNPKIDSTISGKKSSVGLTKSVNGSSYSFESENGSKRTTRLSTNVDGFTNEVNVSYDVHMSFNGKIDGSICCNLKSNSQVQVRGSMEQKNLNGKDFFDIPVTPFRFGEKKSIGVRADTSDSCGSIPVYVEKRITRSRSRLMGRSVEVAKITADKQNGSNSLKRCTLGVTSRKVFSPMQPSVVRVDGEVRRISCSEGKENRSDSCKQIVGNSNRRITRSVSKQLRGEIDDSSRHDARKLDNVDAKKEDQGCYKRISEGKEIAIRDIVTKEQESLKVDKFGKETCERKEQDFTCDTKLTGVKRKINEIWRKGTTQGWTKEQEIALHKAYFSAKPSPHFWKKVAKLVPGKSSQECFDKVHTESRTPVCSKPASRAKIQKSPSGFIVSGSNLFKSAEKVKNKKTCKTKCKSQVTRKTVRHILQKYSHVNQDKETDLFSVFEPSITPLKPYPMTPKNLLKSPEFSSRSYDRSSSAYIKRFSRFSGRSESPLTSPPVLKQVKNMALHEKYIDMLHVRERKRKVAVSRCSKSAQNQKGGENSVQMMDKIRAAKNALVSEAKDAIDKFRESQTNAIEGFSESEAIFDSDNDEDESML